MVLFDDAWNPKQADIVNAVHSESKNIQGQEVEIKANHTEIQSRKKQKKIVMDFKLVVMVIYLNGLSHGNLNWHRNQSLFSCLQEGGSFQT